MLDLICCAFLENKTAFVIEKLSIRYACPAYACLLLCLGNPRWRLLVNSSHAAVWRPMEVRRLISFISDLSIKNSIKHVKVVTATILQAKAVI